MTIAAMLLVNNPGSWSYVYPPLRHAEWHGWTPTDLVFPFFLFIVGLSLSLSFSRRREAGIPPRGLYRKVSSRAAAIFGLGLFLQLFPRFRFSTFRIPGVLQRIALCFFFGALIYLATRARTRLRIFICLGMLGAYWALLTFVPVPGFGPGVLAPKGNLCGFIDAKLLGGHLYLPGFDPEGILSTLPAIVTVLMGTLAGDWIRSGRPVQVKGLGILSAGIPLIAVGLILHPFFPINKQLWTSTYVLFSGGAALLFFGICYLIVEAYGVRKWSSPFLILGTNAIAVFAGSTLMVKLLFLIRVHDAGKAISPPGYLYAHILFPAAGPYLGSLAYAVLFTLVWILLGRPLYKRKIFIRL